MTYTSPFWAIEGELILEAANFKEEGLVTPKEWEREKEKYIFLNLLVYAWNWTRVTLV